MNFNNNPHSVKSIQAYFKFTSGVVGEQQISLSDNIIDYNKILIYCRPTSAIKMKIFSGNERLQIFDEFTATATTNNILNFDSINEFVITAGQNFFIEQPVRNSYFFIRITNTTGAGTAETPFETFIETYKSTLSPQVQLTLRDSNVLLSDFTQTTRPISNWDLDVKDNNLIGYSPFKFTAQGDYSNNERLLQFTPYQLMEDMVQATTANRAFVIASGSGSDSNGIGDISGARVVQFTGLTETGIVATHNVNMGGLVGQLVANNIMCCVNSAKVITVGTLGSNVGQISMVEGANSAHAFLIQSDNNIAMMPVQYVGANTRVYLSNIKITYNCNEPAKLRIYRTNYKTVNNNGTKSDPIQYLLHTFNLSGCDSINYKCDDILEDRDVIYISAITITNAGSFTAGNIITCEITGYNKQVNFTDLSA